MKLNELIEALRVHQANYPELRDAEVVVFGDEMEGPLGSAKVVARGSSLVGLQLPAGYEVQRKRALIAGEGP